MIAAKKLLFAAAIALLPLVLPRSSLAQNAQPSSTTSTASPPAPVLPDPIAEALRGGPQSWTSPERLSSTLQIMLLLTVVSLAPAILLMTTGFVRIIVVLGLLRQALGTQQLPPSQVVTSIALFMTLLLMAPVWNETYEKGIRPYTNSEIGLNVAFERGVLPIRKFMSHQIQVTKNDDDVY